MPDKIIHSVRPAANVVGVLPAVVNPIKAAPLTAAAPLVASPPG